MLNIIVKLLIVRNLVTKCACMRVVVVIVVIIVVVVVIVVEIIIVAVVVVIVVASNNGISEKSILTRTRTPSSADPSVTRLSSAPQKSDA